MINLVHLSFRGEAICLIGVKDCLLITDYEFYLLILDGHADEADAVTRASAKGGEMVKLINC